MNVAGVKTVRGRAARSSHGGCWIGTAAWVALSLTAAIDAPAAPFEESIMPGPGVGIASEPESVLLPRPATAGVPTMQGGAPVHDGMGMMQNADGSWVVDGSNQEPCERCDPVNYGDCPDPGFRPVDGILNRCLGDACPRWVVQADALMLWRGEVPSRVLFTANTNVPDEPYVNLDQIYAPVTVGPRVALLLNIDRCYALEANYFYLDGFNGTGTAPNDGNVYYYNNVAGVNTGDITDAQALTSGKIQSFELNWRRWNGRSLTWLAGFRWVEWNEGLDITSNYSDPGSGVTGTDNILVNTRNDLYGGQVGVDAILLTLFNRVRFNGIAKAGLYGNWNAQSTLTAGGDSIGPAQTFSFQSTPLAFMGEVGVNGTLRLTRNWSARAGYNFFWLTGLATAGPQLDSVDYSGANPSSINADGSVFLNGLNVGTEFIW